MNFDDLLVTNAKPSKVKGPKIASPLHNAFNYAEMEQRKPVFSKAFSENPLFNNGIEKLQKPKEEFWDGKENVATSEPRFKRSRRTEFNNRYG